jgi:ribosomal protein L11 methyltransferase
VSDATAADRPIDATAGWRITVEVAAAAVPLVEAALDDVADAVAAFEATDGRWRIDAFATRAPDRAALEVALALAAAAAGTAPPALSIAPEPVRDWVAETIQAFPPIHIGPFHLHGSHDAAAPAPPARIAIQIDAGIAFGSGRHASTAGCLLALAGLSGRPPRRALDLGCGSGILAIAMAKLWRRPVLATDIDERAVATAAANARQNRVVPWVRTVRADGLRPPALRAAGPFDLIVANILARPLKALAADVAAHLAPGGRAVLSGFLAADAAAVLAAYRARGLGLERRIALDGWHTLVLRRRR